MGGATEVLHQRAVMLEVAMECHGNRARTCLEQFKETFSKKTQMQPQDDVRIVYD